MNFSFSTVGCPAWDFSTIARQARDYGYAGVEIRGYLNEPVKTAADLFSADPLKLRDEFAAAKVQIAALSSGIAMTGILRKDAALAVDLRKYIDAAEKLGCGLVKILDTQVPPGKSRSSGASALAKWLTPIGDYAAERGVGVVVENALSFRRARELWMILEAANHPAIGACWEVFNAAIVGEGPFVSVPALNSRIVYAKVKDAKFTPTGAQITKLGEGDVPVQSFLTRLRGIGYEGFVTYEWDKATLASLAEPEQALAEGLAKLKQWTAVEVKVEKKPAVKKA